MRQHAAGSSSRPRERCHRSAPLASETAASRLGTRFADIASSCTSAAAKPAKRRSRAAQLRHGRRGSGQVPRSNLGAVDRRAAFSRPLDVHGRLAGHESSALLLGSRGVRKQRRPGIRRPAPRRGGAGALWPSPMDKRKRSGEESALASALALARSEVSYFQGRVEQAKRGEEHRSRCKSRNQHEATAFFHRRSRKTSAVSRAKRLEAVVLNHSKRPDRFGRHGICAHRRGALADRAPRSGNHAGHQRRLASRERIAGLRPGHHRTGCAMANPRFSLLLGSFAQHGSDLFHRRRKRCRRCCAAEYPHLLVVPRQDGWADTLILFRSEALRRVEASERAQRAERMALESQAMPLSAATCSKCARASTTRSPRFWAMPICCFSNRATRFERSREQIRTIHTMALRLNEIMQRFSSLAAEMRAGEKESQAETSSRRRASRPGIGELREVLVTADNASC